MSHATYVINLFTLSSIISSMQKEDGKVKSKESQSYIINITIAQSFTHESKQSREDFFNTRSATWW